MTGPDVPLPPPPPSPPARPAWAYDDPVPPVGPVEAEEGRPFLVLLVGLVLTAAVGAAAIVLWPADDASDVDTGAHVFDGFPTTVPGATGEPSRSGPGSSGGVSGGVGGAVGGASAVALFEGGAAEAVADVVATAGSPDRFLEIVLYPTYAFVAYVDPVAPGNIDRRPWRDGAVGAAEPNQIDDRVDPDTEPALFTLEGIDLGIVPDLVRDAATRYPVPVDVTHIILDRFLPFDERVLFRVYASPSDGRSGGGYVSYDTAGALVNVCC